MELKKIGHKLTVCKKIKELTISAIGTDVRSVTAKIAEGLSSGNVSGTVGFDVKA